MSDYCSDECSDENYNSDDLYDSNDDVFLDSAEGFELGNQEEVCYFIEQSFLESLQPKGNGVETYGIYHKYKNITFMLMDFVLRCNYEKNTTEAFIFGRLYESEKDVCVIVEGWQPFLYIKAPWNWKHVYSSDELAFCEELKCILDEKIKDICAEKQPMNCDDGGLQEKKKKKKKRKEKEWIYRISVVQKKSIYGFSPEGLSDFLKIEMIDSWGIRQCKDFFEGYHNEEEDVWKDGYQITLYEQSPYISLERKSFTQVYDGEVDCNMQFMVDLGIYGCQWCTIENPEEGENIHTIDKRDQVSTCHLELKIHKNDLKGISLDDINDLGLLRVLSFDIEAAGRRGVFPEAQVDPVIQIGIHFFVNGISQQRKPILLCLRECEDIEGVDVFSFEDELEMLNAFSQIIVFFDPDIFTGYNICNFDFPYLQKRATVLEHEKMKNENPKIDFDQMAKLKGCSLTLRETVFQSVQTGKRKRTRVTVVGRVCLDMLTYIQNNQSYKLEKYSLNAVSEYFLGDHKVDIPFTQITPMWEKDSHSRAELGKYCAKDAELPISLILKLDALTQVIEIARSTGIPFDWVLQRGIMIRNTRLLLERALLRNFVFPNISMEKKKKRGIESKGSDFQKYEGATVLDAFAGIHVNVGVLDFSAMYPSIIRAHNLCYSTIVLNQEYISRNKITVVPYDSDGMAMDKVLNENVWFKMNKHIYVPEKVTKGLIPEVVEFLQNCRNKAKKSFAIETDPMKKKICKAREMAFKVAGNGMYGSLGSSQSLLPLLAIAETVTAIGRSDIRKVKQIAESVYKDCLVVYGDTDSVFVKFNIPRPMDNSVMDIPTLVEKTSEYSILLAEKVNLIMKLPKKIEFEKVYSTMLCLSKKRYAGIMYSSDHKWGTEPPIDIKGMQCVRRDGCGLTRDLVRDCITSILHTGSHIDAVSMVKKIINDIFSDSVEIEKYAIRKVLRKSMQDCCNPMNQSQLLNVRKEIYLWSAHQFGLEQKKTQEQLSYAEQDEAIRNHIKLPWNLRIRLPHVLLVWKMRLKDPGSAPVLGESISYIVTNNGGKQIFEKVETLEYIQDGRKYMIDRRYYVDSLRVPLENIFLPIYTQTMQGSKERALYEFNKCIWNLTKCRAFTNSSASKSSLLQNSPIAMLFRKKKLDDE